MSQFYQQVFATEVSGPMRKHLAQKGFHVLDIDRWTKARYPNPDYQQPHLIIAGRRVWPDQCPQLVWSLRQTSQHHIRHSSVPEDWGFICCGSCSAFPTLRGECSITQTFPTDEYFWLGVWRPSGGDSEDIPGLWLPVKVLVSSSLPLWRRPSETTL